MNIVATRTNPRDEKQGFVQVTDDKGGAVEAWTPDLSLVLALDATKPIPEGWLLKDNKAGTGKVLLPPKQGGGGGGYRNTKEAFDREAESRAAWQEKEEERKDKRTALMQARQSVADSGRGMGPGDWENYVAPLADEMYAWLRKDSPEAEGDGEAPKASGETTSEGAEGFRGKGSEAPSGTTPEGGRATGQPEVQPPTGPGDPGEASAEVPPTSPGRPYPMLANKCKHGYPQIDGKCSGCGKPGAGVAA